MYRRYFFLLTSSLLNIKKVILKSINMTQIFNCGPKHPGRSNISVARYWKIRQWAALITPAVAAEHVYKGSYYNSFSSKFVILSSGLSWRWLPPKIDARWRYRLLINHLTVITTVSFVSAFSLVLLRKPENASKCF